VRNIVLTSVLAAKICWHGNRAKTRELEQDHYHTDKTLARTLLIQSSSGPRSGTLFSTHVKLKLSNILLRYTTDLWHFNNYNPCLLYFVLNNLIAS
jgi:hypothetical protein